MGRKREYEKCHHFNGIMNKCCDAGIEYDSVRPDGYRLPCLEPSIGDDRQKGDCSLYRLSTPEEIAAEDAAFESAKERFMKTLPLIAEVKSSHEGEDWSGVVECPVCSGKLHMSHAAYNGHVHGQCETKDCLAWME
jgi:hypothetical protein